MASEAFIDIDSLLEPISGENPAGERINFMLKEQLDQLRIDINPEDYAPDDPQRPDQSKPAEWKKIIDLASSALKDQTKDLLLASRLLEALVKQYGFGGFRDGLRLIRRMIGECWDRLLPVIEEPDDVERRVGPMHWLDSIDSGGLFPSTLRMTPVVIADGKSYSWQDFRLMQEGKGSVSKEDFDRACQNMPHDKLQTLKEDLEESVSELEQLYAVSGEKMGQFAPGMTEVRRATIEIQTLVKQILGKVGPGDSGGSSEGGGDAAAGEDGGGGGGGGGGSGVSRDQLYKQLRLAAQKLRQLEPHSPVPYLVDRAVELGDMPFPMMIRALIRDAGVLTELDREIGIKRGDSDAPPASS